MSALASPRTPRTAIASGGAPAGAAPPCVLAGVASEIAARLRASVTFIRVLIVLVAWLYFWPVLGGYAAAALLIPRSGRRLPGWGNVVALIRAGVLVVLLAGTWGLAPDRSGLFGQGPAIWAPYGGVLLVGVVALFAAGRSRAGLDEREARRIVISLLPAAALTFGIGAGMVLAPGVRWELVLDAGLVGLCAAIALGGARLATGSAVVAAALLAALAILMAGPGARLQGGIGHVRLAPGEPAALPRSERLAAGSETLDLRALRGRPGVVATIDASVGVGSLTIELPDRAQGTIDVRIGVGQLDALAAGRPGVRSGFDLHRTLTVSAPRFAAPSARPALQLRIVAAVGRGCVTILQGDSSSDSSCGGL